MRIKLPKGIQVEIDRFTVVAIALTIPAVVVWVISFGLTGDVDALLVGWGAEMTRPVGVHTALSTAA